MPSAEAALFQRFSGMHAALFPELKKETDLIRRALLWTQLCSEGFEEGGSFVPRSTYIYKHSFVPTIMNIFALLPLKLFYCRFPPRPLFLFITNRKKERKSATARKIEKEGGK